MAARVTLKDIARKTGFAVITVSKALHNHSDLSKKTCAYIQQVAREMGYIRNASASSLRSGVTNTLALIIGDITNPLFSIVAKQLESRARKHGYAVVIMNTDEMEDREMRAIDASIAMNVDGILLFPCQKSDASVKKIQDYHIPCVLLGRKFDQPYCPSVVFDDCRGGYLATHHLLEQGYRRILMINSDPCIYSARERQKGYLAAHADFGVPADPDFIVHCEGLSGECARIIEEKMPLQFDAIFSYNDVLAFEAINALSEKGLQVPGHVGVVGFDDIQSTVPYPFPLTSVSVPEKEIASSALSALLALIEDPESHPADRVLDVSLVIRGSTRKI